MVYKFFDKKTSAGTVKNENMSDLQLAEKLQKRITITNAVQKMLYESNQKPNKIWLDKGSKFYNRSIEMYSAHNEGKSLVAERFIRTLKNKIYKYLTSI